METTPTQKNNTQPMGFGKTMLASAVGFIIGTVALSLITFLLSIVFLIATVSSMDDNKPLVGSNYAVELNLTGEVSESAPNELMSLFSDRVGSSLSQMLTAIDGAATDKRVKALYLHLGGSSLSWAQAEELQIALQDFRSLCDKPVIAYGDALTQQEYFLATVADRIAIHPSGLVDFRGIGADVMFYKGLLDKVGAHMELIRPTSCSYKSAGEAYTRTDMSDANRQQIRSYINSIWHYALQVMATNRGLTTQQLNTVADNLEGYLPEDALKNHLVDTLCFEQDIKSILKNSYDATRIVKAKRYAKAIEQEDKEQAYADASALMNNAKSLADYVKVKGELQRALPIHDSEEMLKKTNDIKTRR